MNAVIPNTAALQRVRENAAQTLDAARVLINRSYLSELQHYGVRPYSSATPAFKSASDLRIFRIDRIVQNNKQSVLESTTAAYTALGAAGHAVFLLLRSDGVETEVYIGSRGKPGKMLGHNAGELLRETFRGHFSGSALQALNQQAVDGLLDGVASSKDDPASSITAVTGVPALSSADREQFAQGLERFIDAAEQRVYQAIILAEPIALQDLDLIRTGYEQIATQLSPLLKQQLAFGVQESDSIGFSISQGLSESLGHSLGLTCTTGQSQTRGTSTTETTGSSRTSSSQTAASKTGSIIGASAGVLAGSFFGPLGAVVGAQVGSAIGTILSEQESTGTSHSHAEGRSESHSDSWGESRAKTESVTHSTSRTDSRSANRTTGANRQVSIDLTDKSIEQLLERIDHHLMRIDEAKTYGGWNSAAYFIGDSTASSEALASLFLGLIRGSKSSHEDFALTTWNSARKSAALDWLAALSHPQLDHHFSKRIPIPYVTPATLVSGRELAIQLSLPRRSTSTVAVVETQAFGRKVQYVDGRRSVPAGKGTRTLRLGQMRHLWENLPQSITLALDQLTSHVFVSGSTGAGKSNTMYQILSQIEANGIPFLVIEPAKGEYKHVFGHNPRVRVYGTNPAYSELLRINPFRFPEAIHVLEHVDRLIEIFSVCWPMYAAMPAVLKEALLLAYEQCGWDLELSVNRSCADLYPSFGDLLATLHGVIDASVYSQEVKGNYIGSLTTRVQSLTNGLNGRIFAANEIDADELFERSAIVDLSRVGSAETKALIMGILVMRLNEHRMAKGGMNQPLRHVTVLEEAHHLLKRDPVGAGAEGAGVAGKSVEMLTNAIAEMRTYGEGFIIVDQSPNAVDVAAIRNTNTKIIMRLPDEADRRLIGKSAGLHDEQLEEIGRLPKGVAVVHQNDWLEPVLCQVTKFEGETRPYVYEAPQQEVGFTQETFNHQALRLLLAKRVRAPYPVDLDVVERGLRELPLPGPDKIAVHDVLRLFRQGEAIALWQPQAFESLARLVVNVLGCRLEVRKLIETAADYEQLQAGLDTMVGALVRHVEEDLSLAIQQCVMKDYSLQRDSHLEIYAAWRTSIENRKSA